MGKVLSGELSCPCDSSCYCCSTINQSSKSVTLGEFVCMAWKEKLFVFADKTNQLFYSHADNKSTTKK